MWVSRSLLALLVVRGSHTVGKALLPHLSIVQPYSNVVINIQPAIPVCCGCHPPHLVAIHPHWLSSTPSGCHPPPLVVTHPIWLPPTPTGCHPPHLVAIHPHWLSPTPSDCCGCLSLPVVVIHPFCIFIYAGKVRSKQWISELFFTVVCRPLYVQRNSPQCRHVRAGLDNSTVETVPFFF